MIVKRNLLRLSAAALAKVERTVRNARRALVRCNSGQAQIDHPNNSEEWDRLYDFVHPPVTRLASPVALELARLSRPGDLLLETGCGSASISAELAVAGRRIELADFSQSVLDRAQNLFERSHLSAPGIKLADLTRPLPWADGAVDITWSSGVLEHWTDKELEPIVREMARVSRRRVISLVPHAGSVFYRWGKWTAEKSNAWPYGRELPRETLRHVFERAGLSGITESTVWSDQAVGFLGFYDSEVHRDAARWWESLPEGDILRRTQGYLLLTTGEVP